MRASSSRWRAESRASTRAFALFCTIAQGCIPSHRLVHEGDVYFEHCYAADFDARVSEQQREQCWQAWLAGYTKLQPAHRVDYALRRIEALQNGEPTPSLPELASAAPGALGPADGIDAALGAWRHGAPSALSQVANDAGPVPNGCERVCSVYEARCARACPDPDAGGDCANGCARERSLCLGGCY